MVAVPGSGRFSRKSKRLGALLAGSAFLALSASSPNARAYEPATTLAGLTEQAALQSRLHKRLMERFGCSLGLFEPLHLELAALPETEAQNLFLRLASLDPAEGYAPELSPHTPDRRFPSARAHVLGWLGAGTTAELLPPVRERHHFFSPLTGKGLSRPADQTSLGASLQSVNAGLSSVRELLAGAALDGSGHPAPDWIESEKNELGLAAFQRSYAQAVTAEKPIERESALAQTLMSAGAMLAVLEQAGDPAYVRNDLAAALDGSFQHFVAQRYGRAAVPAPGSLEAELPLPAHLHEFWSDGQGHGLAERTARSFFSLYTLPGFSGGAQPAVAGLAYPTPPRPVEAGSELPIPRGWPRTTSGYIGSARAPQLLLWQRTRSADGQPRLRFALDERTHAAYAAALLPEIGRFAQLLLDFLFRGDLRLELREPEAAAASTPGTPGATDAPAGDKTQELRVVVGELPLGSGEVVLLGDFGEGTRRPLLTQPVKTVPARAGAVIASFRLTELPLHGKDGDANRLVVLFRGRDRQNEPVISSAQLVLPRADEK